MIEQASKPGQGKTKDPLTLTQIYCLRGLNPSLRRRRVLRPYWDQLYKLKLPWRGLMLGPRNTNANLKTLGCIGATCSCSLSTSDFHLLSPSNPEALTISVNPLPSQQPRAKGTFLRTTASRPPLERSGFQNSANKVEGG